MTFIATSSVGTNECIGNIIHSTSASGACPGAVTANAYTTEAQFLEGPVPPGGGTVTNLIATVNAAPATGTHTVQVMNNTTGTVLVSCAIAVGNTSCTSNATATIPVGNYLQVRVVHAGGAATNHNFRVTFRY